MPETVESEQPNVGEPVAEDLPDAVKTEVGEKAGSRETAAAESPAPVVKKPFDIVEGVENYIAKAIEDAENEEETITAKVLRQRNSVARLSIAMLRMDQGKKTIKERYEDAVELLDSMEKDAEHEAKESTFQPNLPFDEKSQRAIHISRNPLEWNKFSDGDGDLPKWSAPTTAGYTSGFRGGYASMFLIERVSDNEFDAGISDDELFSEAFGPIPTFPTLDEAKAFCQMRDDELWAAGIKPPDGGPDEIPVADDSWRKVQLHTLTPAIGKRTLKALIAHSPEINALGTLADWQEKKGNFWATDISGLGAKGKEEIENAQMAYWQAHQQAVPAKSA